MPSTLITQYLGQGLLAARPATPSISSGAIGLYYATDTGLTYQYANGAWAPLSAGIDLSSPPLASAFPTIINGGTASPAPSVTDTSYGLLFDSGATASSQNYIRAALQNIPSATTFTVTMGARVTMACQNYRMFGLCVTDGTKFSTVHRVTDMMESARYTNLTTFGSSNAQIPKMTGSEYYWRIKGDGTNLIFSFSRDGRNFVEVYRELLGAYLGTITKVGPVALANADLTPPAVGDHIFADIFYYAASTP